MRNRFDAWDSGPYLCHYRTKGSKNGIRLYQNEDGTWTQEGLERRRFRERVNNAKNVGSNGSFKDAMNRAGKKYAKTAEFISGKKQGELRGAISSAPGKVGDTVGGIGRIVSKISSKKAAAKQYAKARKMSDAELQKTISRMNLERQYVSLTTKDTSQGWELARETLGVIGGLTAIALASMQIYQGLKR